MPKGTGVSPGIAYAQAFIWHDAVTYDYVPRKGANPQHELERFDNALQSLQTQTGSLWQKAQRVLGADEAAILEAYSMILADEENLLHPLRSRIQQEHASAEYAVYAQFEAVARQFLQLDDAYMRQRADDVFALRDMLMRQLMGEKSPDASHLDRPTILVAHSLSPSDITSLDLSRLEGIVCEVGGYSTHTAIISRTLGIPAIMAAAGITQAVRGGQMVALDGDSGEVWIEPNVQEIAMLRRRDEVLAQRKARTQVYRGRPTITTDGRRIELSANAGWIDEVKGALEADAEALGMFRTEILHVQAPTLPDEETQFAAYRELLAAMGGKAVTVRTVDNLGMLMVNGIKEKAEENPVLGLRGIRISLARPSFFRTQLRALLRASAYGNLRVLFPMISHLDELQRALSALEQVKKELRREGIPFDEALPVGIDIEVPAAALQSEALARHVSFFSIGISGLVQFAMAVDRTNEDLAYLYHYYHPAILRLVDWTVQAAHNNGIPCTISGEVPGHEQMLPLLLGLGVDGFSMSPNYILPSREILNSCNYIHCRRLAQETLALQSSAEVMRFVGEWPAPPAP